MGLGTGIIVGAAALTIYWAAPKIFIGNLAGGILTSGMQPAKEKTSAELLAEALKKSQTVKGLYMTADVANDQGVAGTRLRKKIIELADETEINGLVIDVKEVCGPDYNAESLKKLIAELHQKKIWVIARIVAFKDASQIETHPDWYLTRKSPKAVGDECGRKKYLRAKSPEGKKPDVVFWRDKRGGYWLDPAHQGAREYIADFSKKIIDLGFDELQFDYLRFPSDGDVENAIYPAWDGKAPKYSVMKSFFEYLNKNLKAHKPDIILSADLFGYAAIRAGDVGIGQRLDDIGDNFDYVSFMVYPSHYYSGLYLQADPDKNLPVVNFSVSQARKNPDVVVYRSLQFARDFLDGKISTSTFNGFSPATSAITLAASSTPRSRARLRPWLEDFFHEEDRVAGRPWGVEKIRKQVEAAEKAEPHGWLLWNAANIYTEGALNHN